MYTILGLGNNPKNELKDEYKNTPHNIGGEILEMIAENITAKIILSKTYMNNSADNLNKDDKKNLEKLIIIQDDIDMSFGKIKIIFDRNDGGHNGIKDIIEKTKSKKFIRIKIGVCPLDFFGRARKPQGESLNKYLVSKKLSKKYLKKYLEISEKIEKIIKKIISEGKDQAMNEFNSKK